MDAKTKRVGKCDEASAFEAVAKSSHEDGDLRGLGALLFDEEVPAVVIEPKTDDEIQKTLNSYGVKYSHRNDDILAPNRIEEERARADLQERKRLAKMGRKDGNPPSRSKTPEAPWPPKRKHHQAPPSPKTKLKSRQKALIALGMIKNPSHLSTFAQDFARKSREEQNDILAKLDAHAKKSRGV
ncbi:hypothetical protein JAAARDRAFT_397967 [Jaapia argillacea MUCL 33604]|uniref:Uncharacterized protein n=1 Tax=Jaapia argillacea MUCL 33604 TaxID=933084 RepID=A0A067PTD5_9AGAM|nr:hypothetical protein JAAARDRAFT_397967 [Jaapia argillacea MUCL 33604]